MIEQYIAMYLPVALTVIGYFVTFLSTLKRLKNLTKDKVYEDIQNDLKTVISQNKALREQNKQLLERLSGVHIDEEEPKN